MEYVVFNGRGIFRFTALIRRELLLNRLESIEELREKFLGDNNFDASNTLKNWHDEDWIELQEIEKTLDDIEIADGPVTGEMMKEVYEKLREIQ